MEDAINNLTAVVSHLVQECEDYRAELSKDREKAMEYFDGRMKDLATEEGRSQAVSRDVRSTIKKVLPSLIRTILGNEKVAEYQPVAEGDEASAEQATDYISNVVFPESNGTDAVQDAIHDALLLRNGVIRWWYDTKVSTTVTSHSGLDQMSLVQLVSDDTVTVLEQSQDVELVQTPDGQQVETPIWNVKIRRRTKRGQPRLAAVAPEKLLIHPDALTMTDSPITGINERLRRSELVEMGYDRDAIDRVPVAGSNLDQDGEEATRRRDVSEGREAAAHAMQEVEYYELYVRVDEDKDGIAELRRLIYAGAIKDEYLLENEEWDEVPFADIIVERRPHQREGNSIADDTMEAQKIKTALLRETLDNIYWQNKAQPILQEGTVVNPDAVLNPAFGKPIRVKAGTSAREALGFTEVPFVGNSSFQMMEYFDREVQDVTGINDASGGLAPDALQNVTAKASAMVESAGIAQAELMASTLARGLVPVFKGLLKLTIKHQDKPRVVRLRNKWVAFDPRPWNAEMDVTVNTGLGAGTRERDMMVLQMLGGIQEKLLASYGPVNNPFVTAENVYNLLVKTVEASGLRGVDQYFTKPDMAKLAQMQQQASQKPDPAMQKIQAQTQAAMAKAKLDAQNDLRKMEIDREVRLAEINSRAELQRYQVDQEISLKRQQNAAQIIQREAMSPVHLGGNPG